MGRLSEFVIIYGCSMGNYSASLTWKRGLWIGFIAALLDLPFVCVISVDIPAWQLAQLFMVWTLTGWVVVATESGLRPTLHGMLVTTLLSIPWLVQYAYLAGRTEDIIPLAGLSFMFGAIFGRAKRYWSMHD